MEAAVKSVRGGMGLREASRLYNVPVETLKRRVIGIVDTGCRPGPPTVLTEEEEMKLTDYVVTMADMGLGLSREDLRMTAFRLVDKSGRSHPFRNGMAGLAWLDGFFLYTRQEPKCYELWSNCSLSVDARGVLGRMRQKFELCY